MKKIDVEKSTIFGVNEDDNNKLKLGIRGYFSNCSNFETYTEGKLDGFTYSQYMTTEQDLYGDYINQWCDYFIPEDKVVFKEEKKPKKLRPFKSIEEFYNKTGFNIGQIVQIKRLGNYTYEETSIFNSFRINISKEEEITSVIFGSCPHPFEELFRNFRYLKNSEWLSFGIKE